MKTNTTSDAAFPESAFRFGHGCPLNSLTNAQRERLYDWLEMYPLKRVLEMVQAAAPEGFGIQTHLTTLRRFHARAHEHFQRQLMADTTEALANNNPSDEALESLTLRSIRRAALELSTTHHNSPTHFNIVARWLTKLKQIEQRDTELKLLASRLELETKKFEFNAAREALNHLAALREIFLNDSIDDQDKMTAARKVMFGPAAAAAALAAEQSALGAQGQGPQAAPLQIVPFPLGNAEGMSPKTVPAPPFPLPPEAGDGLVTQAEAPPHEPTREDETPTQPEPLSHEPSEAMATEEAVPDHEPRRDNETPVHPVPPGRNRREEPRGARGMRPQNQRVLQNAESKHRPRREHR